MTGIAKGAAGFRLVSSGTYSHAAAGLIRGGPGLAVEYATLTAAQFAPASARTECHNSPGKRVQ